MPKLKLGPTYAVSYVRGLPTHVVCECNEAQRNDASYVGPSFSSGK
jgi:hypothetical protein